jgi:hypothetical protein
MRPPSSRTRLAAGLWLLVAAVAWNALYDVRITLGVREYLLQVALHESGRAPAILMADAMRATVRDAVLVASWWAAALLLAAAATVRLLRPS